MKIVFAASLALFLLVPLAYSVSGTLSVREADEVVPTVSLGRVDSIDCPRAESPGMSRPQ
jgi:hypothetical protein